MLLLLLATAEAQAPTLAWNWTSTPVRYVSTLDYSSGVTQWLMGRENDEARASSLQLQLALACVGEGDKRVDVSCEIEGAHMTAVALEGKEEMMARITSEWEQQLESATLTLEIDATGRIRSIDLEGLHRSTSREAGVIEAQRMFVTRVVSPLDLQLPKGGVADGSWKQKGSPLALRLMSTSGTAGGVRLIHEVTGEHDGYPLITTVGEAVAVSGANVEADADQTIALMLSGQALFDPVNGQLVKSTQVLTGKQTAQNTSGLYSAGNYMDQQVVLERVEDFSGYDWVD